MTASGRDALRVSRDELGIVTVTIDRAEVLNAFDNATIEALDSVIAENAADPETSTIVVTGAGRAFSTGADLQSMEERREAASGDGGAEPREGAVRAMEGASGLIRTILRAPVPVIAAVNGAAAGVGVSVALAADVAVLSEEAYLFFAFTGLGLMPDGGATYLLAASVGRAKANDIVYRAKAVPAAEACALGLVAEVVAAEDFEKTVGKRARAIARGPREALRRTKIGLNAPHLEAIDAALDLENESQTELILGAEFAEGSAAILEKRRPDFVSLR